MRGRNQEFWAIPPYIERHCEDHTKELARELLRITRETQVLLGQLQLYFALSRSQTFADAVSETPAAAGTRIVVGSLMRTMVTSSAALFDRNGKTSNVPKLLKTALGPKCQDDLEAFHRHYEASEEMGASRARLERYRRKLKRGELVKAVERIRYVRDTQIAHFDANPSPIDPDNRADVRKLDHVIIGASIIVGEANRWVFGRTVDKDDLKRILREQAKGMTDAIRRGVAAE
jgi:hypothetical protein